MLVETEKSWEEVKDDTSAMGGGLNVLWKIFNTLNQCIIAIICFYTCWLAFRQPVFDLLEMHVVFTTVGYQLLMAETIMTLCPNNSWSSSLQRSTKKAVHWALASLGSILAIAGYSIIIYYTTIKKPRHFSSNHGIVGLVAFIFLLITFATGPVALFARKIKFIRPSFIKIYHYSVSSIAFIFGIAALCLGYKKGWFRKKNPPELVTCFIVFSSITAFLTLRGPLFKIFNLVKGFLKN